MLSSGDPSRIVPFPSPVSRPYDLLCFVCTLRRSKSNTSGDAAYAALGALASQSSAVRRPGLTMKVQRLPAPKLTFVMFLVAGCSGPLPNTVPLPPARSSPPVSHHLLHLPEIQSGMENPHPLRIFTSRLTSPSSSGHCLLTPSGVYLYLETVV